MGGSNLKKKSKCKKENEKEVKKEIKENYKIGIEYYENVEEKQNKEQ